MNMKKFYVYTLSTETQSYYMTKKELNKAVTFIPSITERIWHYNLLQCIVNKHFSAIKTSLLHYCFQYFFKKLVVGNTWFIDCITVYCKHIRFCACAGGRDRNVHVCLYSLAGIKSYLSDLCHNFTWCQKWDREVTKHLA